MKTGSELVMDSLQTGAIAAVATTAVAAGCAVAEGQSPVAPLNATSHIVWGDKAAAQDDASLQYTATGVGLNAAAVLSWAALYEWAVGDQADKGDVAASLFGGAAVSALAYVTDYYVVPERFTPGFEKRLSGSSLFAIYGALALSLGLGGLLHSRTSAQE